MGGGTPATASARGRDTVSREQSREVRKEDKVPAAHNIHCCQQYLLYSMPACSTYMYLLSHCRRSGIRSRCLDAAVMCDLVEPNAGRACSRGPVAWQHSGPAVQAHTPEWPSSCLATAQESKTGRSCHILYLPYSQRAGRWAPIPIVLPSISNDRSPSSRWGADELSARAEQAAYACTP